MRSLLRVTVGDLGTRLDRRMTCGQMTCSLGGTAKGLLLLYFQKIILTIYSVFVDIFPFILRGLKTFIFFIH